MGQYGSISDVVGFASDHIQKLIGLSLLREATEILLYMSVYLHNTGQEYDIVNLYSNLSELLEQRSKTSAANDEIKDVLLTKTTAKLPYSLPFAARYSPRRRLAYLKTLMSSFRTLKIRPIFYFP